MCSDGGKPGVGPPGEAARDCPLPPETLFQQALYLDADSEGETADFGFSFFPSEPVLLIHELRFHYPWNGPKRKYRDKKKKRPMETPKLRKNLKYGEKVVPLSRGGFSDVLIKRFITGASRKHFFSPSRRDVETQLLSNGATPDWPASGGTRQLVGPPSPRNKER